MSVGKYSPTVSSAYSLDQGWWNRNGGETDRGDYGFFYDVDGYDSYGYNEDGVDRAGISEDEYLSASEYLDNDDLVYPVYDREFYAWRTDENGFPKQQ